MEDHKGKVVFKSIHSPDRFLSARSDKSVALIGKALEWEQWTPYKNNDSTWSFLSYHRTWLSSWPDESARLVDDRGKWEQFRMETWYYINSSKITTQNMNSTQPLTTISTNFTTGNLVFFIPLIFLFWLDSRIIGEIFRWS